MAVAPGTARELARSARGWMAAQSAKWESVGAKLTLTDISIGARWLRESNPGVDGLTPQQARAIMERAYRSEKAAQKMHQNQSQTIEQSQIPRDPLMDKSQPRYRYEVIVTYTAPDGSQSTALVTVRSDALLSASQIADQAAGLIDLSDYFGAANRRAIRASVGEGGAVVRVTGVYQR